MGPAVVGEAARGFDAMIRYELAEEILAFLRTDSARRLRQAQTHDPVDDAEVARLTRARDRYRQLRADMHHRSPQEIEAIISEYGPRARAAAGAIAS